MPSVTFTGMKPGRTYTIHELALRWGYVDYHALARGIVTPRDTRLIILFMTEDKKPWAKGHEYRDSKIGSYITYEGPHDHFAEQRMIDSERTGDEIHLFRRDALGRPYTYEGELRLVEHVRFYKRPSQFTFQVMTELLA